MTLRVVFLWLLIATPAWAMPTLLVLGDSLSAGYGLDSGQSWVDQLQTEFKSEVGIDVQILNASISGDTSAGGLSRLPGLLARHQPDFVLIALGANDGLRGLPLEGLSANIQSMIALIEASGATPLYAGIELPRNYGGPYTRAFRSTQDDIARETTVAYLPFLLEPVALTEAYFQADGLHPTREAQPLIAAHVLEFLQKSVFSK
jgi:acyl-CoA thioesterase I